jgi:hypothetical protein
VLVLYLSHLEFNDVAFINADYYKNGGTRSVTYKKNDNIVEYCIDFDQFLYIAKNKTSRYPIETNITNIFTFFEVYYDICKLMRSDEYKKYTSIKYTIQNVEDKSISSEEFSKYRRYQDLWWFKKVLISCLRTFPRQILVKCFEPPPPVVNKYTVELPNLTKVQVEEIINEGDDKLHRYNFVHSGKQIASSTQFNFPIKIETGHSGDTSYFLQRSKMICIYHDSKWVSWWIGSGESFNELWECYEKYSSKNHQESSRWDSFSINSFSVNGNKWTIRLLTRISDGDWSDGFFPKYMFVESTDFGASWSVQDNCKFTLRECRTLQKANNLGIPAHADRDSGVMATGVPI